MRYTIFLIGILFLINTGLAENLADGIQEETSFELADFHDSAFEESFAFPEEEFNAEEELDAQQRSVLMLPTENVNTADESWQTPPKSLHAESTKGSTVVLTWTPSIGKLPKNVKYYVYELDSATGAALQVGKATTGKKMTLKSVIGGDHTYLVRAEYVDASTGKETYGVFSSPASVTVSSVLWKKKPVVTAMQYGEAVRVTWSVAEPADGYDVTVTHGTGAAASVHTEWVDTNEFVDNDPVYGVISYTVTPVKNGEMGSRSASKKVRIDESWKSAPVITSVTQSAIGEAIVRWKSGEAADRYIISGGKKKVTVLTDNLRVTEQGEYEAEIETALSGKKTFKVTPASVDSRGKVVKGTASAGFTITLKKSSSDLAATNLRAATGTGKITVSWENYNPYARKFEAVLYNASGETWTEEIATASRQTEYSAVFDELRQGVYGFYVNTELQNGRVIRETLPQIDATELLAGYVHVESITLDHKTLTIQVGEKATLKATLVPANATNQKVTWTSSAEGIATVSSSGVVTAANAGNAVITARAEDGGMTATCKVSVVIPVTGVSLNETEVELVVGETKTLKATVEPDNATNKNVTWKSSNTGVAEVSSGGVVTAKASGTAVITVTTQDGKKTADCEVAVYDPVTSIALNKTETVLAVGQTETLVPSFEPEGAKAVVSWSSSNSAAAEVDSA